MAQDASGVRIDRRRVRTRAALLRAGQALFAERAVDGVSIDEITEAADVAKGSFYNHFDDKEGLAREIAVQARGASEAIVGEINAHIADPAERVARALCVFVRDAVDHPERNRALRRLYAGATLLDAPLNRGVRADVESGLAAGRFDGLSPETTVLMIMGVVQIAVSRVLEPRAPACAVEVARELAFGLLRGLGVEAAAARALADAAAAAVFAPPPV